jgi:uncharacterized membrane protein YoaK (UPF0700 family)
MQDNNGGAGMNGEPTRRRSSVPWVAVSMTAGAAFGIVALLNAPGIAYVIVAILAGLAYSLVTMVNRRRL